MAGAPGWLVPARHWQSLVIGWPHPGLILGARWKVRTLAVSHPLPLAAVPAGPVSSGRPSVLVTLLIAPREPQRAEEVPARGVVSPGASLVSIAAPLQQGQGGERPQACRWPSL